MSRAPRDIDLTPQPEADEVLEALTPAGVLMHRWTFDGRWWASKDGRLWSWAEIVFDTMQNKWRLRSTPAPVEESAA